MRAKTGLVLLAGAMLAVSVLTVMDTVVGWLGLDDSGADLRVNGLWLVVLAVTFLAVDRGLRRYPTRATAFLVGFGGVASVISLAIMVNSAAICTASNPIGSTDWWNDCSAFWWAVNPVAIAASLLLVIGSLIVYRDLHRKPSSQPQSAPA